MVTKNAIEFSSLRIGNLPDKLVKELTIAFFLDIFYKGNRPIIPYIYRSRKSGKQFFDI